MRLVSAAFRAAVTTSHRVSVLAEVLRAGTVVGTLPTITGGSVTLDATAASRGRMDLSVIDDGTLGLVPTDPTSLLAPYGNEIRISCGLYLPDGSIERPTVGVFRIDECTVTDGPQGLTLQLSGLDRSGLIIDARFEDAFQVAQGTNAETAVLSVIQPAYPGLRWVFPGSTFTTPLLNANEGDDRWAFAQSIAVACGLELYFDGDGVLRFRAPLNGPAVATFAEGPTGVLLSAARDWKRAGAYNRVIATGENTGETAPARGVATDTNPSSPTYYDGAFGKVPLIYSSQFIVTDAQALAAATTMLAQQLGTTQQVSFGTVVDPSLEPGDTVQITRLRAGINEPHVIDQLTVPLTATDAMSAQTRAQIT